MRAAISRKTTVTVKAVTHYISDPRCIRKIDGAYAVNELILYLNKPEYTEDIVSGILDKLSKEAKMLYNLKKLHIYTPYALYDGKMLECLLSLESSYTQLDVNMFGFHSSVPKSWENASVNIKNFKVMFHDGIAYPNAGTELFAGIENNKTIQTIEIWNYSPYIPKITMSRKMRNRIQFTNDVQIEYY